MSRLLTDGEIECQLGDLPGWIRDDQSLETSPDAPDFVGATAKEPS